jgi:prepilin-type N-terminal cleavage/methylation domain-containing protein
MKPYSHVRSAFTLVELLVVMALMAVLATLTIAFFPSASSSARESRAAVQLQGWLNIAKQRAQRDQAPRGLRLWVTTATIGATLVPNSVTDCQYVEQPDDFTGGSIQSNATAPFDTITVGVDLTNGYGVASPVPPAVDANEKYWSVQPGDYLEVMGTGLMHYIVSLNTSSKFTIKPPLGNALLSTKNYRIVRAPRAVGEETLKLPENTIIDVLTNQTYNNPLPLNDTIDEVAVLFTPAFIIYNFYDIVFSPSGQVISRGVAGDKIHLWVRAPNPDDALNVFRGAPTLVSIFVRTGFVGAYDPDPNGANPYDLVK